MIRIEIRDAGVSRLLANLAELGANLRPPLTSIGETLVEGTRLRFAESRAPAGSAWRPLAPATLIARSRRNKRAGLGSAQPLLDTGGLRNSIGFRVGEREVVVGTPFAWARIHQFGGRAGRGGKAKIPARPFLGISAEERDEIVDILRAYVERARA